MSYTSNKVNNRTMPPCAIIPVLRYNNVEQAIAWLCAAFGFTERWRVGGHRAQLALDGSCVVVTGPRAEKSLPPEMSMLVRIENADAHYRQSLQRGVAILSAPTDFPYGERQYTAVDPGGYVWTFSQSIDDLAPEDWGGTSAS